ncbi:hypothetical protein GCM10023258_33140 [Terrabacter aeriphilus]|uniref:Uncharacterized protein n=1 Tax=Terrabacter aeriphilus TaxID=515662 RepID=A0ABP9JIJ8_9MICO
MEGQGSTPAGDAAVVCIPDGNAKATLEASKHVRDDERATARASLLEPGGGATFSLPRANPSSGCAA